MRFKDWKAYESGAMNSAEKAEVERMLETSQEAREDYAAYQEYKSILQQAVHAEPVPYDRLDGLLPRSSIGRKPLFHPAYLFAAAAVIAFAVFVPRLLGPTASAPISNATLARMETTDPQAAAQWMRQGVDFPVPSFKLGGFARLTGAEYGSDWAAYNYDSKGKKVKLIVRRRGYEFKECGKKTIGKTTFYVGNYVGWNCPSCAYQLTGGDADLRWKLAQAAATEQFGTL